MSGAGSGYDFNAITFSPDGRLFQVEYATKAVEKDTITLAVKCSDGILFASEKSLSSSLLAPNSNNRIFWINDSIACATVGHRPDCYALACKAREEASSYFDNFGVKITVPELVSRVSMHFHQFHAQSGYRPFGCTALFGSQIDNSLYALEPSGQYYGYHACCFGKNSNLARAELQHIADWSTKTVLEAVPEVAKIIKNLHENQNKKWEIEMMWVCVASNGKPQRVPEEIFISAQNE